MDGFFAGEIFIHLFGHKRRERRHQFRKLGQYVMQSLIRQILVRVILTFPETLAAPSDIPVGKIVDKCGKQPRRFVELIVFHMQIDVLGKQI